VCIAGSTPVAGDTCANPVSINLVALADGGSGADLFIDTTTAHNVYEPDPWGTCTAGGAGKDLVYRLTLTSQKNVSITSVGLGQADPVLYLRDSPCDTGPELACSDFTYDGGTEFFSLELLDAGTYYLFVDEWLADGGGQQSLHVDVSNPPPVPANDECPGQALLIPSGSITVTGTTAGATNSFTFDAGTPSCSSTARASGRDVVYNFQLTAPRDVLITVTPTGPAPTFNPVVSVRKPGACASTAFGDQQGCTSNFTTDPAIVSLKNQPAGLYSLWVDGAYDTYGPFDLTIVLSPPTTPPPGDSCANPIPFPLTDGGTFRIDLAGFNHDETSLNAGTCGSPTGLDIVYTLTTLAPRSLRVVATPVQPTDGGVTLNDPYIFVRASPCATGAELVCADDNWDNAPETLPVDGGVYSLGTGTYFIIVGDWNSPPDPTDLTVSVSP
jgi:hypothetical protein